MENERSPIAERETSVAVGDRPEHEVAEALGMMLEADEVDDEDESEDDDDDNGTENDDEEAEEGGLIIP